MKFRIFGLLAVAAFSTAVALGQSRAANLTTLVSFNGAPDGTGPMAGLIADANDDLFGTTAGGGANNDGTVFEIAKTASGYYASTPTILVSFCSQPNCADGATPRAGLIADAVGNLFGTTYGGGAYGYGTVFEIVKTATGYASTPTILYSFCARANCTDGELPAAGLIANAVGNLFGTTYGGGAYGSYGTVFEITGSGFVPVTVASAPPSGSLCNGAYDGIFNGNVTVSAGQECIFLNGGRITGNVTMVSGTFALNSASVGGNVTINGGGTYTFGPATTIGGNLQIQNIPLGSESNSVCGTTIYGNMQLDNNGTAVQVGPAPPQTCAGDTIGGNLEVVENTSSALMFDNSVGGNMSVLDNTGPVDVVGNTVRGNLLCQGNTNLLMGSDNTVGGNITGQCTGSKIASSQ
jgi:uncharacterized repeat protein (TIGR03803 family)